MTKLQLFDEKEERGNFLIFSLFFIFFINKNEYIYSTIDDEHIF